MAETNLTSKFVAFRNGFLARRGPRLRKRLGHSSRSGFDTEIGHSFSHQQVSNPAWVQKDEEVENLINRIKDEINLLSRKHKTRLLVKFDNSEESEDRQIDFLTKSITRKFRKIEAILKGSFVSDPNLPINKILNQNLKKKLAMKVQHLNAKFRNSQKEYLANLRSQKGSTNNILGLQQEDFMPSSSSFSTNGMGLQEQTQMEQQYRDREIQQIAESIQKLATNFQHLANLVVDQGTILDRIDYNMENVQLRTQKGLDELVIADNYSKNSKSYRCILILLSIITFEAIILLGQS